MKKKILALALIIALTAGTAFANDGTISPKALESFSSEFTTATEVNWTTSANYYRAAFVLNGQRVFAYYSFDGEFLSVARYISSLQLPINQLMELKNEYSKYWISDLFELSNKEGTHYYVTLENADNVLKLKSSNGSDWMLQNKKQKI